MGSSHAGVGSPPEAPSVQGRLVAAAGAAVVAATIVNPLDVIKTRMQAQAAAITAARSAQGHHCALHEPPPRHLLQQLSYNDIVKAVHLEAPQAPQRRFAVGCGASVLLPPPDSPAAAYQGWGGRCWGLGDQQAPPCTSSSSSSRLRGSAGSAFLTAVRGPTAGAAPDSMVEACRQIIRQEGLPVLWRGTATSLLIAVPMVGIYMPLYDHLQEACAPALGAAAPVAAGTAARTLACFAVAPFELLRTRHQAAQGRHVTLRDTLASLLQHHHHAEPRGTAAAAAAAAAPGGGGRAAVQAALQGLRGLPRMWTGFGATLARDVPFSALYWAIVEPLRRAMLPKQSHFAWPLSRGGGGGGGERWHAFDEPGGGGAVHHSRQEILGANMVSGFVAGGVAAAATTPLDVVKTRHQIAARGHAQQQQQERRRLRPSVWRTLREVHAAEGWEGLFRGVRPRAYRAAPACAIVISVYELLKSSMEGAAAQ